MSDPITPTPPPPVETPPPPPPPSNTGPSFDPASFSADLDTKLTAFAERITTGIREAFPTPPPTNPQTPPNTPPDPPNDPPRKTDNPDTDNPEPPKNPRKSKDDTPVPGKKSFVQWWFGQ